MQRNLLLTLLTACLLQVQVSHERFNPIAKELYYNKVYNFVVNKSSEYVLEFTGEESLYPPRVSISSNAKTTHPLMVVARQPQEIISWQLPLFIETESGVKIFQKTSRTLCHNIIKRRAEPVLKHDDPIVTVSTASDDDVTFQIEVANEFPYYIEPSREYHFDVSPSEPRYFFYKFDSNYSSIMDVNYDTVIVEITSNDTICMTVSIQNVSCPVFDLNEDIRFRGFFETVDTKGGLTITKNKFPFGFYVVFVVKGDDLDCTKRMLFFGPESGNRTKTIGMVIKPSITYDDYIKAVATTLGTIFSFYLVFGFMFFLCSKRYYKPRDMDYINSHATTPVVEAHVVETICTVARTTPILQTAQDSADCISLEYDVIEEVDNDREVRLGRTVVYLCDLATKDPRVLQRRSYLYLYNVLTVALFYGLPVIQLVITYQNILNQTGQQDLCYYNFLCAHPLGWISDFNHLFSNIGYVLLGMLFLFITYRRERQHHDINFERQYGIPQHYGMFYAMGVSLIMEGVLSASYHVCPNVSNFQFDSSFMYVMSVLCIVKLYQNRHPDINATAYATFGVLACAIVLGLVGILEGTLWFWSFFTVIHLVLCFYLSAQIYYMGCWKLDRGFVMRTYRVIVYDFWSGPINIIRPTYKGRWCLLIIGNICNWAVATVGIMNHQKEFALYLLGIFMMNTLLYFFFYIVMKIVHREKVLTLPLIFLAMSIVCAISAMYFFLHKGISWTEAPAGSRHFNQECKLMGFYDYHDIWHFLSAVGMFFAFMMLLTLDDDLSHTSRTEIRVF